MPKMRKMRKPLGYTPHYNLRMGHILKWIEFYNICYIRLEAPLNSP